MTTFASIVLIILALFSLIVGMLLLKRARRVDLKTLETFSLKRNGVSCVFFSGFILFIMACLML